MQFHFTKPFVIVILLCLLAGFIAAQTLKPQNFAAMRTEDALQQATIDHAKAMNLLTEESQGNLNAHLFQRRTLWTVFLACLFLCAVACVVFTTGGYSAYAVTTGLKMSVINLAEMKKRSREIENRPAVLYLEDGTQIIESARRAYLRDVTGQVHKLGEIAPNPALVQVVLEQIAAGVAMKQSEQKARVEVIQ